MKTNLLKHLTALVFLFCVALSARADVSYTIENGTLRFVGDDYHYNDRLSPEYVSSLNLAGATFDHIEIDRIKWIEDGALTSIGVDHKRFLTLRNVAKVGSNILGTCYLNQLIISGNNEIDETSCDLQYDSFNNCTVQAVYVHFPVTTTIYGWPYNHPNVRYGAFSPFGHVEYIQFSCPVIPTGLCYNLDIKELVFTSTVETIEHAFSSKSSNPYDYAVPVIETVRFRSSSKALDLSNLNCSQVQNLVIGRPVYNLNNIFWRDPNVTIVGDLTFNRINFSDGNKTTDITKLTIDNPSYVNNSNGFTATNNVANKFTNLKNLVITNEVKEIGDYAFFGCTKLESTEVNGNPTIGYYAFPNLNHDLDDLSYEEWLESYPDKRLVTELYIPNDDVAGRNHEPDFNLNDKFPNVIKVVFGLNVTKIGDNMFYKEDNETNLIESVDILGNVTIGRAAFYNNKNLVSVSDNTITECGHWCFGGCSSLKSISLIPCTKIGEHSFSGCTNLEEVAIGSALTDINSNSFEYCSNVKTLDINNNMLLNSGLSITSRFGTNLETVILGEAVQEVKADAFSSEANKITNLTIKSNAVAQKKRTSTSNMRTRFPSVVNVTFGPEIEALGDYIFYGSGNLETVVFSDNVTIGQAAFYNEKNLTNITSEYIKICFPACFEGCSSLTSMDLRSCTTIEQRAFRGCTGLTEVRVYSPLTEVSQTSFAGCNKLKTLYINSPDFLAEDREDYTLYAVFGEKLETIIIGDGVSTIGKKAFWTANNYLKNLTLGENVSSVASQAFPYSITSLTINSDELINKDFDELWPFSQDYGNLKELTFGPNVTRVGDNAFNADRYHQCNYPLEKVTFLGTNTEVGEDAFLSCTNLKSIVGTVKAVGSGSFAGTNITSIEIRDDEVIEAEAFYNCDKLTSVTLPRYLTTIQNKAFANCSQLPELTLPFDVVTIAVDAFQGCTALTNLTVQGQNTIGEYSAEEPNFLDRFPYITDLNLNTFWVTKVPANAFRDKNGTSRLARINNGSNLIVGEFAFYGNKNLESFSYLPLKTVDVGAFWDCEKLQSMKIFSGSSIRRMTFQNCKSLKSVELPESITSIEVSAFNHCSALTEINIPSKVEKIDENAFLFCSSLPEITIPSKVKEIGQWAFAYCDNLNLVTCEVAEPIDISDNVFRGVPISTSVELDVPYASFDKYKNADVWKLFFHYFATDGVKLKHGTEYTNTEDKNVLMVQYARTFKASHKDKWQALFVPFSIDVKDYSEDFDFAQIYAICPTKDTNGNGEIDDQDNKVMILSYKREGKTKANVPYMIRPKKEITGKFEAFGCTLHKAESNPVEFSSSVTKYSINGIYSSDFYATPGDHNYYMSGGSLSFAETKDINIKPFLWYLHEENKDYGGIEDEDYQTYQQSQMRVVVLGEDLDEETAIRLVNGDYISSTKKNDYIFNLNGTRIDESSPLAKGVYVKNGKKFIVK